MVRIATLFLCITCFASFGCNGKSGSSSALQSPLNKTISLGDTKASFESIVADYAGKDITPGLAIVGPNGEHPLHGIVWEFSDYGCVVSVTFDDNDQLTHLDFCTIADFTVSKSHRSESTFDITTIAFHDDKTTSYTKVEP